MKNSSPTRYLISERNRSSQKRRAQVFLALILSLGLATLVSWHPASTASPGPGYSDAIQKAAADPKRQNATQIGSLEKEHDVGRIVSTLTQGAADSNLAQPRALASADFDEDGVSDLVSASAADTGRAVTLWRGNPAREKNSGREKPAAFLPESKVFELPLEPDFLGAGDFNADGHADVVAGQRGGNKLAWLSGDGTGRFQLSAVSELPGELSALAVGDLNRPDGLPEVVVGLATKDSRGMVLVFEGPNGAGRTTPETFAVSAPVTGLAQGTLTGDAMPDLAVAAGRELLLIAGRDRNLSLRKEEQATAAAARVSKRTFVTELRDVALGDFTGDGRLDVAVLTTDGVLQVLSQPTAKQPLAWADWPAEEVARSEDWVGVQRLVAARVTGLPVASIIGVSNRGASVRLARREVVDGVPVRTVNGRLRLSATRWADNELTDAGTVAAVLPLRINGDALDDLVTLRPGMNAPVIVPSAPSAIITVNSTQDTNVRDNVLTLREAILLANGELLKSALTPSEQLQVSGTPAPGLDEVRFNIPAGNNPGREGSVAGSLARASANVLGHRLSLESAGVASVGLNESAVVGPSSVRQFEPFRQNLTKEAPTEAGGDLDTSFNPNIFIRGQVYTFAVQPDGKVVIAGFFYTVNGPTRNNVARLNANGTLDTTFLNGPIGPNGDVFALALQPNGKILIGGQFTTVNGVTRTHIARLNADGTLDNAFLNGQAGVDFYVNALAVQSDGKILLGGPFSNVNGVARNNIARLNADSTLDTTFGNNLAGTNGGVEAVAVQPDGKVVIGGQFTTVNGVARAYIARLNGDGTLDAAFANGQAGANNAVLGLAVQTDGKVVIGGQFTNVNGVARGGVARLNADGTLDGNFLNGQAGTNGYVNDLAVQPDGKVIIGGFFSVFHVSERNNIARLNADGTLDTSFADNLTGTNSDVQAVALQVDGRVLIGGAFTTVNDIERSSITRLNADGTLDTAFASVQAGMGGSVSALAVQPNGKILIGGRFTTINAVTRFSIARLNVEGTLDTDFLYVRIGDGDVSALAVQTDGKILVGGQFGIVNGANRNGIARLNADGTLDTDFPNGQTGPGTFSFVSVLTVQQDGKILIGGSFTTINGTGRNNIARLNADGTLDTTFLNGQMGANSLVQAIAIQTDGKILIGGQFTTVNGMGRSGVARLNADGTLDTAFLNGQAGASGTFPSTVLDLALQNDGRILVGGHFISVNGVSVNNIARLNADGTLDTAFLNGQTGASGYSVSALAVQPDGKVLIGGIFTSVNGVGRNNIARLNPDGSLDNTFLNGQAGADLSVSAVAVQADSKILIGGFFSTVNGATHTALARLFSGAGVQFSNAAYTINENNATATITVTRESSTGAASVNYATVAGGTSASGLSCGAGADYVTTSGTLSWADGDGSPKTFTVSLCDDNVAEGNETVNLALSNPTGTTLGTRNTAILTIVDNETCSYSLNPTAQNYPALGGSGGISVTTTAGCVWTAASNTAWLTVSGNPSGNGNGTASYSVATNNGPARTGMLMIGGQTATVTQDSGCTYSINPTVQNIVAAGGNSFITVTSGTGCAWTATSNAPWLAIVGGATGSGVGPVNYTIEPNSGAERIGTMTIAGQTLTVLQNAGSGCNYSFSTLSQSFGAGGGNASIGITASPGCPFAATSNNPSFVTVTGGASGSGNGTVTYTVAPNGGGSARSGVISITGGQSFNQAFTIVQGAGTGNVRSITLTAPLPRILEPIIIDGSTQPGFAGTPIIEINGSNLAAQGGGDCLYITGGSSTIRSLVLNRFASNTRDSAIRLITNGNNIVEGCYVGTDATGTNAFIPANSSGLAAGITIQSSGNNQIGGTTTPARNLVSGIDGRGVVISDSATGNLVQGNYIGTDITGNIRLGVQRIGVTVQNASGNTIGGTSAGAGNLISGNLDYGVFLQDDALNNLVQGNIIGTNGLGAGVIANGNAGVFLFRPTGSIASTSNTIGGTTPTARNLISGNEPYGVVIGVGATGTLVQGNYIGTNMSGTAALANTYGVTVTQASGSTVGGAVDAARNVISGNRLTGVYVGFLNNGQTGGTGATVQGNYVGTDATGDSALGNLGDGVFVEVQSVSNTIQSNRIAYNGKSGVRIPNTTDVPGTPGFRIQILDNSIYANATLGIDLGAAGITLNDTGDADTGANLLQNFPVLTAVTLAPIPSEKKITRTTLAVTVHGILNSTPNTTFTVHWYFTIDSQCANNQAGSRPLVFGRVPGVMTGDDGNAQFSFPFEFPTGINAGTINTTATDANGNTSEFSACLPVNTTPPPTTVQFSSTGYSVNEGGVNATVTVTRSGNTSAASSVDFAATDGSATQSQDYVVTSGTLNFAAGETSKTFNVLVVDDAFIETNESINLNLSNATGGTLGSPSTATLTITDNDTAGNTTPGPKRFAAMLDGKQETPANNSVAKGTGYVLLNQNETAASVSLKFQSLGSSETAAHIQGPSAPGVSAPILFTLPTTNPVTNFQISPTVQQVADLKAGLHYLNVHSTNFSNGEIRGQLRWNPTLDDSFFVRQQYLDFLSRDGDPGGFNFWVNQVGSCQADAQCLHDRTITTSNAFFFEPEFQQTAGYVFRAYRAAFGNNQPFPNPDGSNAAEANKLIDYPTFVADRARVVGGADLAAAQVAFANLFVARSAFTTKYAAATTAAQFVDAILANIQSADNVNLTTQRQALIDQYNNAGGGNPGRAMVLYRLADDNQQNPINNLAFINAEYNRQFALTLYFGYLRRNPDIGGFLFWQSQINLAAVRDVPKQNALVCSFLTAAEYQLRFGPGAPRSNAECPQ